MQERRLPVAGATGAGVGTDAAASPPPMWTAAPARAAGSRMARFIAAALANPEALDLYRDRPELAG
jgi:hypothetical protein